MLRRQLRLRDRRDVARVYQRGRTVRSANLTLKYLPNQRDGFRVAVVVSKKVAKSAPKRNRIRRRLYEQIRLSGDQLRPGFDLLLSVYADEIAVMPPAQLAGTVSDLLTKSDLLIKHR